MFTPHTLLGDGASGTELIKLNSEPQKLNLLDPEAVRTLHTSYYEAGASVARTNSFSLECSGLSVFASFSLAHHENARIYGTAPGTWQDSPNLKDLYRRHFLSLINAGADHLLIETVTSTRILEKALAALHEIPEAEGCDIAVSGYISPSTGLSIEEFIEFCHAQGVQEIGLNCMTCDELLHDSLAQIIDSGHFKSVNAFPCSNRLEPSEWADIVCEKLGSLPMGIIGGCCGTTPEHIRSLGNLIDQSRR